MPEYVVSACLAGVPCRYNATNALSPFVRDLVERGEAIALCPEVLGGLPTPRTPVEIQGECVRTATGEDCTEAFRRGAADALTIALKAGCKKAILKTRSPSCGRDHIYDGSFTGTLVTGAGFWARLLQEHGVIVYTECELP